MILNPCKVQVKSFGVGRAILWIQHGSDLTTSWTKIILSEGTKNDPSPLHETFHD